MADKNYSLDDILNEYSDSDYVDQNKHTTDINLDDILSSYNKNTASLSLKESKTGKLKLPKNKKNTTDKTDNVNIANSNLFPKTVAPDVSDIKFEITENIPVVPPVLHLPQPPKTAVKTHSSGRSFSDKFEDDFSGNINTKYEDKPKPKGERSFSDKFEMDSVYTDESHTAKKPPSKEKPPLNTADSIDNSAKSLDEIIEDYSSPNVKKHEKTAAHNKGLTDFINKKMKGEVSENTELLDGMKRLNKERKRDIALNNAIARKSINDINLDLDGKIIPDTAPVPDEVVFDNGEYDKIMSLKQRRSQKIKDFVFVGDEEEKSPADELAEEAEGAINDFENFDDAPSILNDISQMKSAMGMRFSVLLFCLLVSVYIALSSDTNIFPSIEMIDKREHANVFLFVNTVIGLLAAFSSYSAISTGLSKLLAFTPDSDTLPAVVMLSSLAVSMVAFIDQNLLKGGFVHVYIPVAVAILTFNALGKLMIVSRTHRSFKFISGAGQKYAIISVENEQQAENLTRGALKDFPRLAAVKKTDFLTNFLKITYAPDAADKFCRLFTPIAIGFAFIAGVLAGIIYGMDAVLGGSRLLVGLSVFTGCLAICSGFNIMLSVNLPLIRASKKHSESQGYILSCDCIDEFANANSVITDAKDLFPRGSVALSKIKLFSDTRADEAIIEAASLANQADSILKSMFYDIIAGKTELLLPVESYIFEDSLGLCGWINNKRVLLGNRELMLNHSIAGMPTETKQKEYEKLGTAVYLSISGELSAMFIIKLSPTLEIAMALKQLEKRDVYVVVRSVDSIVSITKLSELFEVSPEIFKIMPFRIYEDYESITAYQPRVKANMACSGKFSVFAAMLLSCRNISRTVSGAMWLQGISMFLGFFIFMSMVITKAFDSLSASYVLGYCSIFTLVLLAFQMLRRN